MRTATTTCDGCGIETDLYEGPKDLCRVRIEGLRAKIWGIARTEHCDLCIPCAEELLRWIKTKKTATTPPQINKHQKTAP